MIENWIKIVTQEARKICFSLPSFHPLELADLVQAGAEHVLRYTKEVPDARGGMVRVYARHGIWESIKAFDRGVPADSAAGMMGAVDEEGGLWTWQAWTSPLPMELRIDLLRELLKLRLWDGLAWYSRFIHQNDHSVAARELRASPDTMRTAASNARRTLCTALWEYEPLDRMEDLALSLLQKGRSCNQVAKQLKLSWEIVARLADSLNVDAKAERALHDPKKKKRASVEVEDILPLHLRGMTQRKIAKRLGVSQKVISSRLRRAAATNPLATPNRRGPRKFGVDLSSLTA